MSPTRPQLIPCSCAMLVLDNRIEEHMAVYEDIQPISEHEKVFLRTLVDMFRHANRT